MQELALQILATCQCLVDFQSAFTDCFSHSKICLGSLAPANSLIYKYVKLQFAFLSVKIF